ncbi:response regulator [Segetibacter sp. 3557_3]|uniref:response regulator n=1 Tax=Segetibacter sp. 3557_3 TaxID=2547429 RepID=UPI001404DBBA|nr:response regulator [Segetibacter sp. 3557_3]
MIGNIFLDALWQSWWLYALFSIGAITGMAIFFQSRINKLKFHKADLERQVLERSGLLEYARQSEEQAREQAEAANRSKSMVLAKLNHQIRTPMSSVIGMASLLNDTQLTTEQRTYTDNILVSGDGLLSEINDILMKDILEYSKFESGKELDCKDFELRRCIEDVFEVFASRSAGTGLDLIYLIDDNVPGQVVGDALRLKQVLMNLVDNAFRFTSAGEIVIAVHLVGHDEEGRVILSFEVRDTGNGISTSKQLKLSKELANNDPLYQYEIMGVSLIICKKLIGLMDGKLQVDSKPDDGSTFRFNIKAGVSHQRLYAQKHDQMAGIEGKKVLVVEDNLTLCNVLKNELAQLKLKPSFTTTGERALEIIDRYGDFDLVITDNDLGSISGINLAQSIRKHHPDLPVILLGKHGCHSHHQFPSLFAAVIPKPLKYHVFCNEVSTALKQKKKEGAPDQNSVKQVLSEDFAQQYPLNILLAEDDLMNQLWITTVLNKLGYKPTTVKDGKEVLEIVSQNSYNIILMDVQMPEMDGLEATRMIRLCIDVQPIIIAMTANNLQGDREECLRAGMDDYISKPLNLEELAKMLEKWHQASSGVNHQYAGTLG